MARMIPNKPPDMITNVGEKIVYRELRNQLPHTWVVRYSLPACWLDGAVLRDCESDFIVLAPNRGLLLLEVKGSHGYDCQGGIWFRIKSNGIREETRNPFEQAMAMKYRLVERISRRVFNKSKSDFPGVYGHIVVYPQGKVQGALPSSTEPTLMIAYKDMTKLCERLEEAFTAWGFENRRSMFTPKVMLQVVNFLADKSTLVPVLAAKADNDDNQIEDLTFRQYTTFQGILGNQRIHVKGMAGTGKTILAFWSANAMAEMRQRVLLLCFNRVLAKWLDNRVAKKSGLEIRSFFSLCHDVVKKANLLFKVPEDDKQQHKFWIQEAPNIFSSALDCLSDSIFPRYDAIFVDEAQDFSQDWWFPVQLLLRDPDKGRLCLFSDPDQLGIYGQANSYPLGLVSFNLIENCRNTKCIANYYGNVLSRKVPTFPGLPIGVIPKILSPQPVARSRAQDVRNVVVEMIDQKFSPSQIALLSPWKRTSPDSALNYILTIQNKQLQGDDENIPRWIDGRIIWSSTIKSFKGLEADCVILTDVPTPGTRGFDIADFYVGISRAKHRLILAPTSPDSAKRLHEWAKG